MSPDRDRILEQALKHELKGADAPPAGACLDAETLGAWTDGGLDPAAAAACEAHVSTCARCQALVGASARGTADAHAADAALGTPGTPGSSGTFSLWRWWLAPLAAGVTAATLWMVVPEQQQAAVAPPTPQAKAGAAPSPYPAPAPDAASPQARVAPAEPPAQRDAQAFGARADRQEQKLADQRGQDAPKEEAVAERRERDAAVEAAAPAVGAVAQAPPVAAAPPPAMVAPQKSARAALSREGFEIPTLQAGVRWRVVGDFFVELTENNGASWQRKHQLPGVRAGSAPAAGVLWLAGEEGTVWLTTDGGATFQSIGLAEPLDIASVSATDARAASVFTVSGRRFRTDDAGRTWRPF